MKEDDSVLVEERRINLTGVSHNTMKNADVNIPELFTAAE